MEMKNRTIGSSRLGEQQERNKGSAIRRLLMFPLTRLLIAMAVIAPLALLPGYGAMALLNVPQGTSLMRFYFEHPTLAASIQGIAVVGALVFVGKVIERRPLSAFGLGLRGVGSETAKGFALGAAMMVAIIGFLALVGWYDITSMSFSQPAVWKAMVGGLGLFLAVAIFEEVMFRGILFRIVEEGIGSWAALAVTAFLFGYMHLSNPNATLFGALGVALAGILYAAGYMLTRNLWLVIGLHWSWNFVQGVIFGVPVSGRSLDGGPISETIVGPQLWTGGAFGVEAGLVAYVVNAAVSVVLLVLVVRRGKIMTPRWMRRGINKKSDRV